MRALFALFAASHALAALLSPIQARHAGDTVTGGLDIQFRNGTRAGCVDKFFNWVTDDNACDRFRAVMFRDRDDEYFSKPFHLTNSEGWGCFALAQARIFKCATEHSGSWWEDHEERVPRNGDRIAGGAYGYGLPGPCEASPLETSPQVHEFEIPVDLVWIDTILGPNIFSSSSSSRALAPTEASRRDSAVACTSTTTLTPTSTHHTFPSDAPFSVHYPGNLNVIYNGKVFGCLTDDGLWTADRSQCGQFKGGKVCKFLSTATSRSSDLTDMNLAMNDPYIDLTTKKGYCAPSFEKIKHIICTYAGVTHGMHVDGYYLVQGSPLTRNWLGSALPKDGKLEKVSRGIGTLEVQVKWETIPHSKD
jgi:hypothetical protein